MFSWLKARKKTSPRSSSESTRLFKSNQCCLKNFNFCFSPTNMIDCENYVSDDSDDQTNTNLATKTTEDDKKMHQQQPQPHQHSQTEKKSKKKSTKASLDLSKKEANYSIKCKQCFLFYIYPSLLWHSCISLTLFSIYI